MNSSCVDYMNSSCVNYMNSSCVNCMNSSCVNCMNSSCVNYMNSSCIWVWHVVSNNNQILFWMGLIDEIIWKYLEPH